MEEMNEKIEDPGRFSEANYAAIFNAANDAILILDIENARINDVNDKACEMFCYPREELLNLTVNDVSVNEAPYTAEESARLTRRASDGEPQLFEWLVRDKLERLFWIEVNLKRAVIGGKYKLLAIVRDITGRKQTEERLTKINEAFLSFGANADENINRLTAMCGELLGADCALYNRLYAGDLCAAGQWNVPSGFKAVDKPEGHICYDVIRQKGDEVVVIQNLPETEYAQKDPNVSAFNLKTYVGHAVKFGGANIGSLCAVYQYDFVPGEEDKKIMGLMASAIGIEEERRNAAEALQREKERIQKYLDVAEACIVAIDKDERVSLINRNGARLLGYSEDEMIGKNWFDNFIPERMRARVKEVFHKLVRGEIKKSEYFENPVLTKDGEEKMLAWHNAILTDKAGQVIGTLSAGEDITEARRQREKLDQLNKELHVSNKILQQAALKDIQTGLYNHHYLSEIVEAEFHRAKRYGTPLSVMMMDIDYFKSINDIYGHEFGDMVLRQLADQLKRLVRRYDVVIRFGGEEFCVISSGANRPKTKMMAQRLLEAINLYHFGDKTRTIRLKLSMAVAAYPEDKVSKGMELVNIAEKILDRVKDAGGNRVYSCLDVKGRKGVSKCAPSEDTTFLRERIDKLTKRGKQSLLESIAALAKTIEIRDHYTGEHAESTVYYATSIAKALKLPAEEIENIKEAAILHDLGKIGISDRILLKKSKLTDMEYTEIKRHPQIAADILRPIQFMHDIIPLVLYHHERWDGKGYSSGLKGEDIPMGARIIALADVYQALISDRPYRKALTKDEAVEIIKNSSGAHFDPRVVDAFLKAVLKVK